MPDLAHNPSLGALYALALLTALAGGWHCVGMCASIAILANKKKAVFLYQLGRLISYVSLGVLAAAIGHRFFLFLDGPGKWAIAGLLALLAYWILLSTWRTRWSRRLQQLIWRHRPRKWIAMDYFSLGLLNGLLPCHWLYGYLALAASLHDPARGAVLLFSLWAGSLPWLVAVSVFGHRVRGLSGQATWVSRILFASVWIGLAAHYWKV